jgi:RHS repeat-associated protein
MVGYSVDDAGRTNMAYTTGKTYADLTASGEYSFTPDGRIVEMKLGNNLWETNSYPPPGSPTIYALGETPGSWNKLKLEYRFSATGNNGNIVKQVIQRPNGSWTQNYAYDNMNRLLNINEPFGVNRTYGYDQYGNRWIESSTGLAYEDNLEPDSSSDFNSSNNRLTAGAGAQYDDVGNQTFFSPFTLDYDAEGRITSISSPGDGNGTFAYDGDGRRVRKVWTSPSGVTKTTYYVYNALGQLAVEYFDETPSDVGIFYTFTDMLGSVRAVTSETGSVEECYDYLPFGRMLSADDSGRGVCYPSNPDVQIDSSLPQKFTGKERDAETGLDYFLAGYYSGAQGRFLSVDPENAGAIHEDPQSWNGYAYSRNNPLRYTDPDGKRYRVCWEKSMGGDCLEMTDPEYLEYRRQNIDPVGYISAGNIYQNDVEGFVLLGTVKWLGDDRLWAVKSGAELAGPTVNALAIATGVITGGFAALDWIAGGGAIEALGPIALKFIDKVDPNKINHIFNQSEHKLESLVSQFGSKEAAFAALQKGAQSVVSSKGITNGGFEITLKFGAEDITVRGKVIDGIAKIGTAFKK